MSDIVERLRSWVTNEVQEPDPASVILAAADEIARLRLLVPPIVGTVNAETGMNFIPWSVAASAGQAADISRRVAVLPQGFEMRRLSQWIPVGERLPQDERDVLAYFKYEDGSDSVDIGWFASRVYPREWRHYAASHRDMKPTHWMPLPEPPEEAT